MTGLLDRYAARKQKRQEDAARGQMLLLIRPPGQFGLQLAVVRKSRRLLFRARKRRDPTIAWIEGTMPWGSLGRPLRHCPRFK